MRAATSFCTASVVGTSTLPPMWPHFLTEASWSSKCTPPAPALDHGLHQFEAVEHAAEAGFGIGHDRREVVDVALVAGVRALGPLDLVGAAEGVVDALDHLRHRVHRVQRLVGVHRGVAVVVGGDLPARQVDRLDAGLDLLHGLAAGQRAEAVDVGLVVDQVPQLLGAAAGQRVLDRERAAQAHDVGGAVAALDALPAGIGGPVFFEGGDLLFAAQLFGDGLGHGHSEGLIEKCGAVCGRGLTVRQAQTLMSYRRHIFHQ